MALVLRIWELGLPTDWSMALLPLDSGVVYKKRSHATRAA